MGTTPTYSWPYPEATDPVANGAQDIEDLALAVESTVSGIGGKILQIVSTTKGDTYTNATGSFADITGLSVSITPSATTSKVLILVALQLTSDTNIIAASRLLRDSTLIFIADTAGSRTTAATASRAAASLEQFGHSIVHLDSPATTSATTYKVQAVGLAGTAYVNRTYLDTDASSIVRSASSITALEVSA